MSIRLTFLLLLAISLLAGCNVRQPAALETRMMTQIKRQLTVGGKKDKNPLAATEENIHAGQLDFSHYCYACHGLDGQKTGVPFADNMSPPLPSLNSAEVQAYSDGQLKSLITNGISPSGMPAAKGILNDDEIWSLVLYIRHLPAKGSLGEPKAYADDASRAQ